MRQQWQVWPRVSDVAKACRKPLLKYRQLIAAGQVDAAIGGENAGKDAEMRGDALGQQRVRAGREVNHSPFSMLLSEVFQQRLVVGQMHDIDRCQRRHLSLEHRLALADPPGK